VEKSLAIVEQAPALIASEREAALKTLSAEITRTITFVQEERIAALKQLTSERIAAVQELRDTVVQERKILTADITTLSANVVDQAFIRAVQLCAGVLIALFIGAVLLLMIASRLFASASTDPKKFAPSQAPEPAA
jgi:nitrate/nitrite-specific signal transduction histidine kinase